MSLLRPHCAHCIYWMSDQAGPLYTSGHCHRYPPSVHVKPQTGSPVQKFPSTDHHQWCGEWDCDETWLEDAIHQTTVKNAEKA